MDGIIKKLYESFAVGRISDERFDTLLAGYEQEQKTLGESISDAEISLATFEKDTARVDSFLELAKKCTDFDQLTTPMINEFIDRIIVHAPEKVDGDRTQEVEIYLKFIGRFNLPAPELTPEEEKRQNRVCKSCGKVFTPKRSDAVYCSNVCRQRAYRQSVTDKASVQIGHHH